MNNEIINRLSKFSFIMSIIGVCTVGVCPAFAMMGIAVAIVFKLKGVRLNEENQKKIKKSVALGITSLALFVIDIIILLQFAK